MAREVARAEVRALTGAMLDAAGSVLFADDLSADEVGKGLRDVVSVFQGEIDRRIPGWTDAGPAVPTVPTEETDVRNPLSGQDQKALELAKMVRGNPELRERVAKANERNASRQVGPVSKVHPVSKMAEDSPVLAEYENEVLEVMSRDRVSHEIAIGKVSRDYAFHDLRRRYKEEQGF